MKRLAIVAVVMALGAGVAFASSLGVPWFSDGAGEATGLPPSDGKTATLIYLHNNLTETAVCQIQYYNAVGGALGPEMNNTFEIEPNASIAFRPVRMDPASVAGGQESPAAVLVPDRPTTTIAGDPDTRKNGSCVIRWFGESSDVQGMVLSVKIGQSYGHLLPPGR